MIRYGDKELWYATGNNGEWSFPVHVTWKKDTEDDMHYGLVQPAFCPYVSQGLKLDSLLQFHSILHNRMDQWLVEKRMIEVLLIKAEGVTPEYHYRWNDDQMPMIPVKSDPLRLETNVATRDGMYNPTESFVKHICSKYGLPNSVVRLVLRAISNEAPVWMIEHREPLCFGFATLIAAPFRANWKQIVAFKARSWKIAGMFTLNHKEKRAAMEDVGMPQALCSTQNIGMSRAKHSYQVQYCIEAIPTKQFEEAARSIESKRQACGTTSYIASFEKTVEKLYSHLVEALGSYLKKTNAPFATIREVGNGGVFRFMPITSDKVKVRGIPARKLPVDIVSAASPFSVFGEHREEGTIRKKIASVSSMPDVLRSTHDLRGCNQPGPVDEPRQGGADGLLLQDADQGKTDGQPVLAVTEATDRDTSGVAGE